MPEAEPTIPAAVAGPSASAPGTAAASRRATWVLALTSLVVFMVFLDATIVNVAFETISRSLHAPAGRLAWVLNAYSLGFAAMLIPAGRMADLYGRRRMFLAGLCGFTVFSGLCGLAPDVTTLVAARALQAVFAALVVPTALALVLPEFPPRRWNVAIGTQASMGAAAAAVGPTLGALLIEYGSWRWVFLVNIPIGLFVVLAGARLLRETRDPDAAGIPDPLGTALIAAIPALVSFALIEGPDQGWTAPPILAAFALAVILLPAFGWRCAVARRPALDLALFRIRQIRLISAASLLFSVAFYAMILANLIFMQTQWHYSVLRAALAGAPGPLAVVAVSRLSGRLASKTGYRPVLLAGSACWVLACAGLTQFVGTTSQWATHWLPIALLNGIAIGLTLPVQSAAAVAPLPPARFGIGSAVNASFRQLGAVLGVSLFVAVLGPTQTATLHDYQRIWWTLGAIGLASGAILLTPKLPGSRGPDSGEPGEAAPRLRT
jgi:EmrB/QacA subfamily drug resistance transporter